LWVEWVAGKRPATGKVEFTIRTDGAYDDQRVVRGQLKSFHFIGTPLDLTFRYDLKGFSPGKPVDSVRVRAAIADDFRASYSEPTLFTGWQISVPEQAGGGGPLDLTKFKSAVSGITLEFSGTFIKDPGRVF